MSTPSNLTLATPQQIVRVAVYATLLTIVMLILVVLLFQPATRASPDVLGIGMSKDAVLLLVVAAAGILGSMVHVYGSLLVHLRKGDLRERFLPWYWVRPWAGIPIAIVVYLAVRIGIVTTSTPNLKFEDVLTVSTIGGLAGMGFEQFSAKLKQLFEVFFTTAGGDDPDDPDPGSGPGGAKKTPVGAPVTDEDEVAEEHPEPDSRKTPDPPGE